MAEKFCASCVRGDEKNKADAWCSDCAELVCKTCSNVHKNLSFSHTIVPMQHIASLISSDLQLSRYCEVHNDQKLVQFCCQHDEIICDYCISESHQTCQPVISLDEAAKQATERSAITDIERRMAGIFRIMEIVLCKYGEKLSDLGGQKDAIKKEIADVKRNIIQDLDEFEENLNRELDSKYTECSGPLIKKRSELKYRYEKLRAWKDDLKLIKAHSTNIHVFQVIKFLGAQINKEKIKVQNFTTMTPVQTLSFEPFKPKMLEILPSLGTISVVQSYFVTSSDVYIDHKDKALGSDERKDRKVSPVTTFPTSKLAEDVEISRGCFVPDNKILLCDYYENRVYICSPDGSNTKTVSPVYIPRGVTLYDNQNAIVSGGNGSTQMINIRTLIPNNLQWHFNESYNGGITSVSGKIWVSKNAHTLTMKSTDGTVQKTFQTSFNLCDISMNEAGDIYCTSYDNNNVYIVTSGGKERVVYSSTYLNGTDGITVDEKGNVYIAGNSSHNIHRISSDGQQRDIILTEADGIHGPTGLSYNHKTKELMVINEHGRSVHIYKMK